MDASTLHGQRHDVTTECVFPHFTNSQQKTKNSRQNLISLIALKVKDYFQLLVGLGITSFDSSKQTSGGCIRDDLHYHKI